MTILILVICHFSFSQDNGSAEIRNTKAFLQRKQLHLRQIISHDGFVVHYNCDSIPFLKKVVKDTIKIWTESANFAMSVENLDKYTAGSDFGRTIYIKDILSDGRITVSGMHQTIFISRNDSLFEIESGYEKEGPKLIFHPRMFINGRKKVILNKKYNYLGDQIILEQTWTKKGKRCYVIRINNKDGEWETSYSYAFDEDMHFIFWETCDG
jgi:hypothetical protein